MPRRTLKPSRTRIAVLLTAPVLGVALLTPSAWADTPPPGKKINSDAVIGRVCQHASEDSEDSADGQGPSCERDLAPLLGHVIGPGSGLTCREVSPTDIDCRPEK